MKKLDYLAKHTFSNADSPYDTHWWINDTTDYHCHVDYYEIFIPLTDGLYQFYDNKNTALEKRCMYLIPIKQYHRITHGLDTDKPVLFNLSVLPDFFGLSTEQYSKRLAAKMIEKDCISIPLDQVEYDYIVKLSEKLMIIVDETKRRKIVQLYLASAAMLYDLKFKETDGLNKTESFAADLQTRIDNLEYLDTSITDIYKNYPVSPVILIDAFKKLTGKTIVKYMVARRMSYACSLLRNTDFNVLTIAQEVGYDAPSHFIDNFKEFTGQTPSAYRKSHTQDRNRR